jgi:hypothetical protein
MLSKKVLFIFLLFAGFNAMAQGNKNESTAKLLKTANTLLEAQQFEAAEEYFKKGLQNAKTKHDYYNMAAAYEGLGNLYSKTNQTNLATDAYQHSIKLYRAQKLNVIANVVESLLKSVQGIGDLYAGVEIGAKGIKLSVIEVKLSKSRDFEYTLEKDTSINTDAASLSYESEKQTFDAVTIFYNIIKNRFQIPSDKISIVISSGLKQDLDKYNKVAYFANVVRPTNLDAKIKISYVTPEEEAEFSFKGIVPEKNRLTADQLDVGSGNTKGGYFDASKAFIPVTLPLGTKSFQRLIETKSKGNLKDYLAAAEKIMDDSLARTMVYEFANKKDFKSRDVVYISGGIVWTIASLLHPQQVNDNNIELNRQDFSNFRRLVYSSFEKLTNPDITLISNAEDARASLRNINRVLGTYDQKAMLSGAIWLDELITQVNTLNPSKKFIFPKYAYVGWISGYILDKINKQYTGLAKN